jgi:hypothetical protein
MNRPRISLRHTVFGALFTGSLLFGATQAFARPPGYVSIEVSCNVNNAGSNQYCKEACAAQEEQYVDGLCWSSGACICQVW